MELFDIKSSLEEQKPLLVSGCMQLRGAKVYPKEIEELIYRDRFGNLTYEQVVEISTCTSAIEFLDSCKKHSCERLNGSLVVAIANYLMRFYSGKTLLIKDSVDIPQVIKQLDIFFAGQDKFRSKKQFIEAVASKLQEVSFLNYDNEVLIYLVVNFYLYVLYGQVLLFTDFDGDQQDKFEEFFGWLCLWSD